MPAPWQQAIDNANDYSSSKSGQGINFAQGISPAQLAQLKAMGIDTSGLENVSSWQNQVHPIRWQGELGRENLMYNEGRNQVVDLLQQGNQRLAADQLNATGQSLQDSRGLLANQLNAAGQGYYDAGQRVTQGYDRARNEVNQLGRAERGAIMDRSTQQASAANDALRSRGLNNSTLGVNASRAVASDTNKSLNDLTERIGGLRSGIIERGTQARGSADSQLNQFMTNRANTEYGAGQDMANFMNQRTGIETGLASDRINTLNNNRYQYDPSSRLAQNAQIGAAYPKSNGILGQIGSGLLGTATSAFGTAAGQGIYGASSGLFGNIFGKSNSQRGLYNPNG
jgi:hypothetical protein